MFQELIISPSLLSANFMELDRELERVEQAGADWLHYDVIDGAFAPNLTFGVPVLRTLRKYANKPIDVHLMISDPLKKLPWFLDCHPDYVTVHWEALVDTRDGQAEALASEAVSLIHEAGAKAGVALKPDTPTSVLDSTLELWDMVLVMSVFPGFSGQSYIPESADRVAEVVASCKARGLDPLIQVDGGMDLHTAPLVVSQGADVLVAGNAVFAQADYRVAIDSLRASARSAL